jgi:hypothetical protein
MAWQESLAGLWAGMAPYVERLAVWRGYEQELQTLAIYGFGIAVYTALVFAFYQTVSRRKPVSFRASERKDWSGRWTRTVERAIVFPITGFLYFAVIALALFVMTKNQTVHGILLLAMAAIVAVRVTVYMSEAMSNDLAKLIPLSLIAVVLVEPGYLTFSVAWARIVEATTLWPLLARYFLLFIALEAVMSSARWAFLKSTRRWGDLRIPGAKKETSYSVEVKGRSPPKMPPQAP